VNSAPHPEDAPSSAPPHRLRPTFVNGSGSGSFDVRATLTAGLSAPTASIAPRFFYDDLGSRLFAAITALEEYYPTRTEAALLQKHLPAIAAATALRRPTFVDLGAGNCEKAAQLFSTVQPGRYVAVDISADFLRDSLESLHRRFPALEMYAFATDFSERLVLPNVVPHERRLFFYPGSSIGNFTPPDAIAFLRSLRDQMHDGALWIGVDLQKDTAMLELAYDDALGVTAAFNKNVLRHVNRLVDADFDLDDWRHFVRYDRDHHRIEMHLEAERDVTVTWQGGRRQFRRGDRIHTENSYKHTIEGFRELLAVAGLRTIGHWTDAQGWFAFFVAAPMHP